MRILVIGDSCQDVFIYGKCDRLCPDAPVPVFIPLKTKKIGGMATNVYENIKSLGVNVDIITNDKKITKTRYVDEKTNQMIIRVDSEKTLSSRVNVLNEIDFEKDGLSVYFISERNRNFGKKEKLFNINVLNSEVGNYSLYKKIEKEIVLSCLEELNVRDLIKDLVEKFK